jgi:hypothetical protein
MNLKCITPLYAAATLLVSCGDKKSNPDVDAVQAAWDEFKEASLSSKGDNAANRVTNQTHDYYVEIRDAAITATREQLQGMSLARQVTVLGMRVRVPPSELRTMSGRDLFVHAVDKGWIGKNSASDEGITNIQVTGDHAHANATKAGLTAEHLIHFIKEDNTWRFDMMPMMKLANIAFDAMQKESGLNEEEFVSWLIENVTSKRLSEAGWNPPSTEQDAAVKLPARGELKSE